MQDPEFSPIVLEDVINMCQHDRKTPCIIVSDIKLIPRCSLSSQHNHPFKWTCSKKQAPHWTVKSSLTWSPLVESCKLSKYFSDICFPLPLTSGTLVSCVISSLSAKESPPGNISAHFHSTHYVHLSFGSAHINSERTFCHKIRAKSSSRSGCPPSWAHWGHYTKNSTQTRSLSFVHGMY